VRRICFSAASLCALVALVPGPSAAQDELDVAPRPEAFGGRAESRVVLAEVNRDALLPGEDLFQFIALDGLSTYEPSVQTARATLFYPGNGVVSGPNLACGTFGGEFPEPFQPIVDACLEYKFPLIASADSFENDSSSTGSVALGQAGDPVSGSGARAESHAAEDAATTDAVVQDLEILGLPDPGSLVPALGDVDVDAAVMRIDSAASRTRQAIEQGSLVVRAESTLSGVRLIGGLLQIGSLESVSTVTDDGQGKRTAVADLDVSGVTFAGVPARITDKGLVLASPSGSGPLAQQEQTQANELIQELNVRVRVLPFDADEDREGAAVASVGGLQIEFARDLSDLPALPAPPPIGSLDPNGTYTGTFLLGPTSVLGLAASFPIVETPVVPVDPGPFDPGLTDGSVGEAVLPGEAATPDQPGAQGSADSPDERSLRDRLLGGIFDDRIAMAYLGMAFAVLGLCLVPKLTLPARLPGPSS
jgi:hypothetical protein